MKKVRWIYKIIFIIGSYTILSANLLQTAIDHAKPYATIHLSKGTYTGRIFINKPITIIGKDSKTIIAGNKKATVITIKSPDVTLKNITVTGSGKRKDEFDSAIKATNSNGLKIEHCTIKNSLYGIYISMSNNCTIENNHISSMYEKTPLRGDGLRFWYSNHNIIKNNIFYKVRDVGLTRSNFNIIENNRFISGNFGTYIEFSTNNIIRNNLYKYNSISIMLISAENVKIASNKALGSKGVAGIGMFVKGGNHLLFKNNIIKFNAEGFFIDNRNISKDVQRTIIDNDISYNMTAFHFHTIVSNNIIEHNNIFNNLFVINKDFKKHKDKNNIIEYNYWGNYAGFDKDNDNIGDTPYVVYQYADKLWDYNPHIKFFFGSVVMSLANFLCKVAPFTEPIVLLTDKKPLIKKVSLPKN